MCASVEIISNRHFYDVLGDFTFSSRTAWYRSRLIDVALFEGGMSNHWLTGFGYNVDPGWGPRLDGRSYTDTVNHYILELHRFGLVGLVPFLAINIVAAKRLRKAYLASALTADRWLVWCVSGALSGLWAAMMSVSLFGPPTTVFFMLLAFAGLLPDAVGEPAKVRRVARVSGSSEAAAVDPPFPTEWSLQTSPTSISQIPHTDRCMAGIDVSVIIVSWNTRDILRDCLESVYAQTTECLLRSHRDRQRVRRRHTCDGETRFPRSASH